MTPHTLVRFRRRVRRCQLGLLGVPLALLLSVSGCSAAPGPASLNSASSGPGPTAADSPSSAPAGAAAAAPGAPTGVPPSGAPEPDARRKVQAALEPVAASNPKPSREQIRAALATAGYGAEAAEVSASRTPTGLAVEAVEAGVLSGGQCVMAQLRGGGLQLSVLPVLSNGRCFVGSADK